MAQNDLLYRIDVLKDSMTSEITTNTALAIFYHSLSSLESLMFESSSGAPPVSAGLSACSGFPVARAGSPPLFFLFFAKPTARATRGERNYPEKALTREPSSVYSFIKHDAKTNSPIYNS